MRIIPAMVMEVLLLNLLIEEGRLVKKYIIIETPTVVSPDSEEDCCIVEPSDKSHSMTTSSSNLNGVDNLEKLTINNL